MGSNIGFALMLTTLAGLSTTIGGAMGVLIRKPGPSFMALTLGFSAGVMILVSFVELLQAGIEGVGFAPAHLTFFLGMGAMFLVDVLIPHDYMAEHQRPGSKDASVRLMKTGLFLALGIGIHNFPEGLASFAGALEDTSLGIAIAAAIAIHNIPEGLAVAAPIGQRSGSST